MPIALDVLSAANGNAQDFSNQHNPGGTNRVMLWGVALDDVTAFVDALDFNGAGATKLIERNQGVVRLEVWGLVAPATGSHTWSVSLNKAARTVIGCRTFTAVNQSDPWPNTINAGGNGNLISASVASKPGRMVVDFAAVQMGTLRTISGGGGAQVEDQNQNEGTVQGVIGGTSHKPVSADGNVSMTWTTTESPDWALGLISLRRIPEAVAVSGTASLDLTIAGMAKALDYPTHIKLFHPRFGGREAFSHHKFPPGFHND